MSDAMAQDGDRLPALPARAPDAHKGDFGHVLVVAGSPGMTGAGCLAARAAQRAGAGLVTLALPRGLNLAAEVALGSIMSMPLPETEQGALGMAAARAVLDAAGRGEGGRGPARPFDAFALGPGLRTGEETGRMVRVLARELPGTVVIDADGLNGLAGRVGESLAGRSAPTVLTPHPGEMARLMGLAGAAEVQADREGLARRLALEAGAVVVLKGRGTVVTDGGRLAVNGTGNPGMASGGMGDVLTGLIVGLTCQGLRAFDAARLGAFVHGLAGDLAARRVGELSLIAEDVLAALPGVLRTLEALSRSSKDGSVSAAALGEAALGAGDGRA